MVDKERIAWLTQEFLKAIGEDPLREGLLDTPKRVADMYEELLSDQNGHAINTSFEANNYGGIVLVKNICFSSLCEHHLVPFYGKVHIAYIPNERILGISKLVRIIVKYSKKLQLQEKLANEVLAYINDAVSPKGIAIYIEAKHLCMNIRGVSKPEATTVTTVFCGEFEELGRQNLFINMIQN